MMINTFGVIFNLYIKEFIIEIKDIMGFDRSFSFM